MKTFLTIVSILSLNLTLGACALSNGETLSQRLTRPTPISVTPPDGPYTYQQGWRDGCESGIAATNHFFQLSVGTRQFTLDEQLRNDRLYNQAWRYAFNHCGYSMRSIARYDF